MDSIEHLHAGRNLVGGGFCLCEPLFERCERLGPERRSARDEEKQACLLYTSPCACAGKENIENLTAKGLPIEKFYSL